MTDDRLAALAAHLESLGLANGSDFRIIGLPLPGLPGSEYVGLDRDGDGRWVVYGFDMGESHDLLVTADFDAAADRFRDEAVKVASFHRRGPLTQDPDPSMPWNEALGRATHPEQS